MRSSRSGKLPPHSKHSSFHFFYLFCLIKLEISLASLISEVVNRASCAFVPGDSLCSKLYCRWCFVEMGLFRHSGLLCLVTGGPRRNVPKAASVYPHSSPEMLTIIVTTTRHCPCNSNHADMNCMR